MRRFNLSLIAAPLAALYVLGCEPTPKSGKTTQAERAQQAADSITFTENAEIENIKWRLQLTSSPGKLGFIVLFNQAGQPILYEGVHGKVTSGSKRLTPPVQLWPTPGGGIAGLGPAPSDEGTWGSSAEYIFYKNTEGVYRQWSGMYLYSDQPIRLRVEPVIVTMTAKQFN
jgi:hypothetical protein